MNQQLYKSKGAHHIQPGPTPSTAMKKGNTAQPKPSFHSDQVSWTQMSLNSIMNCGPYSSDQMIDTLNKRMFGLSETAIVKEISPDVDFDPLNGINLNMRF